MDAIRPSDNDIVVLKRVNKSEHEFEVEISKYFSSEDLRKDPRNHCVPVFDVLDVPDQPDIQVIVLPLLRRCNDPRWGTVGEAVAFFDQVLEASSFHDIVLTDAKANFRNRDCSSCTRTTLPTCRLC